MPLTLTLTLTLALTLTLTLTLTPTVTLTKVLNAYKAMMTREDANLLEGSNSMAVIGPVINAITSQLNEVESARTGLPSISPTRK